MGIDSTFYIKKRAPECRQKPYFPSNNSQHVYLLFPDILCRDHRSSRSGYIPLQNYATRCCMANSRRLVGSKPIGQRYALADDPRGILMLAKQPFRFDCVL